MFGYDINNQTVAHQSNQHDECKEEGDQPGICEERVLIPFLHIIIPTSSQGEICLGAIDPELLSGVPELLRVHCDRVRRIIVREVRGKSAEKGEWAVRDRKEEVTIRNKNVRYVFL